MDANRVILHCDLNSFFASVELLRHPELRSEPVAVCGDPSSRHGIILAKNEPAKKYGVVTAETIWQARGKCPELILLPPHHALYREYSHRVNAVYEEYTDLVEPFGIDESWLDLTGSAHLFGGEPKQIADEIRNRVHRELGLTLSVGVSFNKVFAKLGSDYKKPDATTVISRENWKQLVFPLPMGALLFVGKAAQRILKQYGIEQIGQLAACKPEFAEAILGKTGQQLWSYANGLDCSPVRSRYDRPLVKTIGNGSTFRRDLTAPEKVREQIAILSDHVAMRLRASGLYAAGVSVTLRTPDFRDISRQKQFDTPTHLMRDLTAGAMELVNSIWHPPSPIRMLTVTAIRLLPPDASYEQMNLFGTGEDMRREKLENTMDGIRGKFGIDAIQFGKTFDQKEDELL